MVLDSPEVFFNPKKPLSISVFLSKDKIKKVEDKIKNILIMKTVSCYTLIVPYGINWCGIFFLSKIVHKSAKNYDLSSSFIG